MANRYVKNYKQPSIVSGLSMEEIFGDDGMDLKTLQDMKLSDLRKVVSRGVSALNKRIRRVYKANVQDYSPSILNLAEEQRTPDNMIPSFSIEGVKDRKTLIKAFKRMKQFYGTKTSTVKGAKKERKRLEQMFGDKATNRDLLSIYYRSFTRFQEMWNKQDKIPSEEIQQWLNEHLNQYQNSSMSEDEIVDLLVDALKAKFIDTRYTRAKTGGKASRPSKNIKSIKIKRK